MPLFEVVATLLVVCTAVSSLAVASSRPQRYCFDSAGYAAYEAEFGAPSLSAMNDDDSIVDVVYTYVNGSDPFQLAEKHFWEGFDERVKAAKAKHEKAVARCKDSVAKARRALASEMAAMHWDQQTLLDSNVGCARDTIRFWVASQCASGVRVNVSDLVSLVQVAVVSDGCAPGWGLNVTGVDALQTCNLPYVDLSAMQEEAEMVANLVDEAHRNISSGIVLSSYNATSILFMGDALATRASVDDYEHSSLSTWATLPERYLGVLDMALSRATEVAKQQLPVNGSYATNLSAAFISLLRVFVAKQRAARGGQPVDSVYNDGRDAISRALLACKPVDLALLDSDQRHPSPTPETTSGDHGDSRFTDHDELRFSMRSIERFTAATPTATIPLVPCRTAQIRRAPSKGAEHSASRRGGSRGNRGWVRNIFIVTNGQVPDWLDLRHPRVRLVTHEEIFPAAQPLRMADVYHSTSSGDLTKDTQFVISRPVRARCVDDDEDDGDRGSSLGCWRPYNASGIASYYNEFLPTFSSPAIEAQLHRIRHLDPIYVPPSLPAQDAVQVATRYSVYNSHPAAATPVWFPPLSKRFLYFNDDTFLGSDISLEDFISAPQPDPQLRSVSHRVHKLFESWEAPHCNIGCPSQWLGDGQCDVTCNIPQCVYDLGDCSAANAKQSAAKVTEMSARSRIQMTMLVGGGNTTSTTEADEGLFSDLGLASTIGLLRKLRQQPTQQSPRSAVESLLEAAGLQYTPATGAVTASDAHIRSALLRRAPTSVEDAGFLLQEEKPVTDVVAAIEEVFVDLLRAPKGVARHLCAAEPGSSSLLPASFGHWMEEAKQFDQLSAANLELYRKYKGGESGPLGVDEGEGNGVRPEYYCSFGPLMQGGGSVKSPLCLSDWIGNGKCDKSCDVPHCGFDAFDCVANTSEVGEFLAASLASATVSIGGENFIPGIGVGFAPLTNGKAGRIVDFDVEVVNDTVAVLAAVVSEVAQTVVVVLGPRLQESQDVSLPASITLTVRLVIADPREGSPMTRPFCTFAVPLTVPNNNAVGVEGALEISPLSCARGMTPFLLSGSSSRAFTSSGRSTLSRGDALSQSTSRQPLPTLGISECILQARANETQKKPAWASINQTDFEEVTVPTADKGKDGSADYYADSLKFTNLLLSQMFGTGSRYVPAHMPHLINTEVVEELWNEEQQGDDDSSPPLAHTSSPRAGGSRGHQPPSILHDRSGALSAASRSIWRPFLLHSSRQRFRSPHNIQFGFLHFHFMKHVREPPKGIAGLMEELLFTDDPAAEGRELALRTSDQYRRLALMLWEGVPAVSEGGEDTLANDPVVNPTKRLLLSGHQGNDTDVGVAVAFIQSPSSLALSSSDGHLRSFLGITHNDGTAPAVSREAEMNASSRLLFKHCCCNPKAMVVETPRPPLRAAFSPAVMGAQLSSAAVCFNATWRRFALDYLVATSVPLVPVPRPLLGNDTSLRDDAVRTFINRPRASSGFQYHYDLTLADIEAKLSNRIAEGYSVATSTFSNLMRTLGCPIGGPNDDESVDGFVAGGIVPPPRQPDAICSRVDCNAVLQTDRCVGLCVIDDTSVVVERPVLAAVRRAEEDLQRALDFTDAETVTPSKEITHCEAFTRYTHAASELMRLERGEHDFDGAIPAPQKGVEEEKPWATAVIYDHGQGVKGDLAYREKRESKQKLLKHAEGIISLIEGSYKHSERDGFVTHREFLQSRERLLAGREEVIGCHLRAWSLLNGNEEDGGVNGTVVQTLRALRREESENLQDERRHSPTKGDPLARARSEAASRRMVPFSRSIYALDQVQLHFLLASLGRIHALNAELLLETGTIPGLTTVEAPPTAWPSDDDDVGESDSGFDGEAVLPPGTASQPPQAPVDHIAAAGAWRSASSNAYTRDADVDDSLPLSDAFYGRLLYLAHVALTYPDMVGADALGGPVVAGEEGLLDSSGNKGSEYDGTPAITFGFVEAILSKAIASHVALATERTAEAGLALFSTILRTFAGEVLFDPNRQTQAGLHNAKLRQSNPSSAAVADAAMGADGSDDTVDAFDVSLRLTTAAIDQFLEVAKRDAPSSSNGERATSSGDDEGDSSQQLLLIPTALLEYFGLPASVSIEGANATALRDPTVRPIHRAILSYADPLFPRRRQVVPSADAPGFTKLLRTAAPHHCTEALGSHATIANWDDEPLLPRWSSWWRWPNPSVAALGYERRQGGQDATTGLTPVLMRRSYLGRFMLSPFGSSSGGIAFEERTTTMSPVGGALKRELAIRKRSYFLHANRVRYPVLEISSTAVTVNAVSGGLYYNNRNRDGQPRPVKQQEGHTLLPRSLSAAAQLAPEAALKDVPLYYHAELQGRIRFDFPGLIHPTSYPTYNPHSITFIMIKNNATVVTKQLDHVRLHRSKFVCLNDDIDHALLPRPLGALPSPTPGTPKATNNSAVPQPQFQETAGDVVGLLRGFLREYYPRPSTMERPGNR